MKNKLFTLICALMVTAMALSACGGPKTVKDFMNTAEAKTQLAALESSLENDMMSIVIEAEDDALILVLSMKEDLGVASETFAPVMEQALAAQSQIFVEMANEIKSVTKQSTVKVILKCLDHKGEELFSTEYESNK